MNLDELLDSTFARAFKEAEKRKAEEEARRVRLAEEALANGAHVYDPRPYPEAEPADPSMYAGTGIGALYDLPGAGRPLATTAEGESWGWSETSPESFLAELGDWTLGKEPS